MGNPAVMSFNSATDWASRCKQIMKIWRKVSAADKVPFLVGCHFLVLEEILYIVYQETIILRDKFCI